MAFGMKTPEPFKRGDRVEVYRRGSPLASAFRKIGARGTYLGDGNVLMDDPDGGGGIIQSVSLRDSQKWFRKVHEAPKKPDPKKVATTVTTAAAFRGVSASMTQLISMQTAQRLQPAVLTIPFAKSSADTKHSFKVGDKVELVDFNGGNVRVGDVGTILQTSATGYADGTIIVNFPSQLGYAVEPRHIKLVKKTAPKPKVQFDSVIMPERTKQEILDAVRQVDHHELIFSKWGFGSKFEKGTAISMLFYGPPGTGKTLMGQAIADKYGKKLKVVSTAEIESSEPGQAERNLKAYFEESGDDTVLLFDECDSLIADRRAVGMILAAQINALLMALEQYKGIVIFTTNRLEALDPAFERRLSLKVEFEMPDQELRKQIWINMYPKKAPLAKDIDWDKIASVEIAGGNIKNVVLKTARMAANSKDKRKLITEDIIIDCLESELKSMYAFTEAIDSNNLPRIKGSGYTIRKG